MLRSPGKGTKNDLEEAQELLVQAVKVTKENFAEEGELDSWSVDDASPTRIKSMKEGWKQEHDRDSERSMASLVRSDLAAAKLELGDEDYAGIERILSEAVHFDSKNVRAKELVKWVRKKKQ